MAIAMPLPNRIAQDSTRRVKQRLLTAQFGDGYFTSAPDGINSIFEEWDISWPLLNTADRNTVVAVLMTAGAGVLLWTPNGDSTQKRYQIVPSKVATLYQEQPKAGNYWTISCSLVQVR